MRNHISENGFTSLLKDKLGKDWDRALLIFKKYNIPFSFEVTAALIHACDKGEDTIQEVLVALESHWKQFLQDNGTMNRSEHRSSENPTLQIFETINKHILKIDESRLH